MENFDVVIRETTEETITIPAENEDQAIDFAIAKYEKIDFEFGEDAIVSTEIQIAE